MQIIFHGKFITVNELQYQVFGRFYYERLALQYCPNWFSPSPSSADFSSIVQGGAVGFSSAGGVWFLKYCKEVDQFSRLDDNLWFTLLEASNFFVNMPCCCIFEKYSSLAFLKFLCHQVP